MAKDSSISRASGFLQRRRTVTAATLAERLEVSERTVGYTDGKKDGTSRVVRPLGLSFVGHAWLLTAWCELRESFRNFRLDRVTSVTVTQHTFAPEAGKRFEDFLELMAQEPGDPPAGG